ncbi:DUF5107 domain-containing protein [Enterococcus rivorum]|uniref:DUF5107 domain-containing protein n=1 Tax=Enterococcus rivorum TaxID=762845 RepID=A0A1E5KYL6_9ENTE|nr:DUF5107 domain-containing protein [Enterococcus rivorum]MBP2097528.1 tetratricopeptide (TPR) repeat protein [Enterococcus rivorum]OEH82982.1 DUF5107 domain-containing protein [Enterococcus rivorum]
MTGTVKIWEEKITMPTYLTSKPDKNPLFFEKRVYQGSSGKVYPHAITEKIYDEKVSVDYPAVILENDYLKVVVLPTLGGRIQRAYDKTNDYDFVYYNQVIKPALVGLIGPWISGGIEFNWPQHHRPSTYLPTEYELVENKDGSKTLWVSEIDKMYGTKGMAGFTLYPDSAYIEITGKVTNRTDTPQTFLWWANPAVPANDHTVSIFPPDVHAVMDHGKRAVSDFPIATGTYYKYDYSEGIDISRYKNIKVPTSYMAYHSDYDFIGNYDEKKEAGLLHVANHHISPGKKQWGWGNSDFGLSWDRNLTDEDGPYIELMTGVFTDNQPDFTWLKPYEEKEFKQYFMPYKGVGRVKNATIEAAVNLEIIDNQLVYAVYATKKQEKAKVVITYKDQSILEEVVELNPASYLKGSLVTPTNTMDDSLVISVYDRENSLLVSYTGLKEELQELPKPAEALPKPQLLKTTEELFLAATHIEQYRHATLDAEDYYLEGLKRDETDIRLNNGYGMFLYKRGLFIESEKYFKQALKKQTWKTPNPYYGEPSLNLGLVQMKIGKMAEATDHFFKATWNEDTQAAAFYQLAIISTLKGEYQEALILIDQSLVKNNHHMKARNLKITLKRLLNQKIDELISENLAIDPLDLGTHYEKFLKESTHKWKKLMRDEVNNYLELALDYLNWGFLSDAEQILLNCSVEFPMIHYYLAYIKIRQGQVDSAIKEIKKAESISSTYCFPNKLDEIEILNATIELLPEDTGFAKYYLGNLFYDKKRYEEAITLWEESSCQLKQFPTVYRNLSFAYYNNYDDQIRAEEMITHAVNLDKNDARLLLEQDLMKRINGASNEERVKLLEEQMAVTQERDDLFIVYISLLNSQGQYEKALHCLENRQFHPWEGGEGKVSSQYLFALIEMAKKILEQQPEQAIELLKKSKRYPHNLGEGKLPNVQDTIADFYIAKAYQVLGDEVNAHSYFMKASEGDSQPESVLYYYDQPADSILYRGMAFEALGNESKARSCYHQLIRYGELHIFEEVTYDYFAVSLPETVVFKRDLQLENKIYCEYLIALGNIGLKNYQLAKDKLEQLLQKVPDHQGLKRHLEMIEKNI